ncbi:hypothetical protein H920_00749 [Fukomys damarensis]|uniref:Uncharacterized protein n=1 Tax=Fukomys damarensis TaxID=885580 RepID=A0A091E537_FUKDA|nr:hypothetical protein H920_00749 [Fukomys damarensis]
MAALFEFEPSSRIDMRPISPNRTRNPRVTGHHSLRTAGSQSLGWRQRAVNTLCCLPRPRGRSLRTPRRESTWERVRGWMTKSRRNRPLGRNRPALVDSTGQASPDPATDDLEMRASPGEVSPGLAIRRVEPLSPGQEHLGLAVTVLAQVPMWQLLDVQDPWAKGPSTRVAVSTAIQSPLEKKAGPDFFLGHCNRNPGSTSSVLDSSLELHSRVDLPAELLTQQEQAEPTEAEPKAAGPAPAQTEVPPVECVPAPPAAPSSALAPQPEPVPGTPPPPVAPHGLLVVAGQEGAGAGVQRARAAAETLARRSETSPAVLPPSGTRRTRPAARRNPGSPPQIQSRSAPRDDVTESTWPAEAREQESREHAQPQKHWRGGRRLALLYFRPPVPGELGQQRGATLEAHPKSSHALRPEMTSRSPRGLDSTLWDPPIVPRSRSRFKHAHSERSAYQSETLSSKSRAKM